MKNFRIGFATLFIGFRSYSRWLYLGLQDIRLKYRRSLLGPWWITLSSGLTIFMLSIVWSKLFNMNLEDYVPFFGVGFIFWGWISSQLIESTLGFTPFKASIKQINLMPSIFIFRINLRNFVILLHNLIIVAIIYIYFGETPSKINLISLPGIFLVQLNITFLMVIISILCTRFQDMGQIFTVIIQIIFLFTPILWDPAILKGHQYILEYNIFYHWIELVRAPLLNKIPTFNNWIWSSSSLVIILIISTWMLGRFKNRIPHWI
jgi:lipopolysaccharide transport system permease protein